MGIIASPDFRLDLAAGGRPVQHLVGPLDVRHDGLRGELEVLLGEGWRQLDRIRLHPSRSVRIHQVLRLGCEVCGCTSSSCCRGEGGPTEHRRHLLYCRCICCCPGLRRLLHRRSDPGLESLAELLSKLSVVIWQPTARLVNLEADLPGGCAEIRRKSLLVLRPIRGSGALTAGSVNECGHVIERQALLALLGPMVGLDETDAGEDIFDKHAHLSVQYAFAVAT
mmetsp:Transcript_69155/g.189879  ORF Transcript_69155/g.189879 Transcript_69155/m.189879 type:complete len:224 (-) Transcript_69155:183-854(-)